MRFWEGEVGINVKMMFSKERTILVDLELMSAIRKRVNLEDSHMYSFSCVLGFLLFQFLILFLFGKFSVFIHYLVRGFSLRNFSIDSGFHSRGICVDSRVSTFINLYELQRNEACVSM